VPGARACGFPSRHRLNPLLQFDVVCAYEPFTPVGRHRTRTQPVAGGHDFTAVAQRYRARFRDDLTADVVAVPTVDEDLDINDHTVGHLQDHDQWVLEIRIPQRRPARLEDRGGADLLVEEPANQVDLVDGGVADHHV